MTSGLASLVRSAVLVIVLSSVLVEFPVQGAPTPAPTTAGPIILVPSIEIDSSLYAVLDQVDPYTPDNPAYPGYVPCSTITYVKPPGGWIVAPVTSESIFAATNYYWGSPLVILADGSSWATNSTNSSVPVSTNQLEGNKTAGYRPKACVQRVLITIPSPTIPIAFAVATAAPVTTTPKATTTPTTKAPTAAVTPTPTSYRGTGTLQPTTPNPATYINTIPVANANFTYPPPIPTQSLYTSPPSFPPSESTEGPVGTVTPTTYVFPPDRVVTINGLQYATLDEVGPNGEGYVDCNSTWFRTLPYGWSLADPTNDSLTAISVGTWGIYSMILSDGTIWLTDQPNTLGSPAATGGLVSDGQGGYAPAFCQRILITAPAPTAAPSLAPTPAGTPPPTYVPPPDRVLTIDGIQYTTIDGTGPNGEGDQPCSTTTFLPLPSGWSLAAQTTGSLTAISSGNWGTYIVGLADGTGWISNTPHDLGSPNATDILKTDGQGGYTSKFCDNKLLISAPAPYVEPPPTTYTLGLKVLVISQYHNLGQDYRLSSIVTALRSFGIPYDLYTAYDNNTDACNANPPVLETSNTHGKYYAIAMSSFSMFVHSVNCAPISLIRAYQEKFHVRLFSAFSSAFVCCSAAITEVSSPPSSAYLKLDTDLPSYIGADLKRDLAVPILQSEGSFQTVQITDSAATPVLRYVANATDVPTTSDLIASAIYNSQYGEEYHQFYDHSEFLLNSAVFGDLWVKWLVKGIFFGMRRSYLNPHGDDLVISTALWVPAQNKQGTATYRATAEDLNLLAAFQANDYPTNYGPGDMKVLFPVNCFGLYSSGNLLQNDSLRDAIQANAFNFYYVSHTYSHMDLTCVDVSCPLYYAKSFELFRPEWEYGKATNYSQALGELTTNNASVANVLFAPFSFDDFNKIYSLISLVNPRISGLFNPNSIKAMTDFGLQFIVGDNTRNELYPYPEFLNDGFDWPPAAYQSRNDPRYLDLNFYHGRYLTAAVNGYNDPTKFYRQIFMIPRFASEIYYDCSTLEEDLSEYNFLKGTNRTYQELYAREGQRVVFNLLWHRWDPHMFHQANIRRFEVNGKNSSLVQLWIETVVGEFRKYSTLPVSSINIEDLGRLYVEKMEREVDCGFDNTLTVSNGTVQSFNFSSNYQSPNGCYVRLTGVSLGEVASPPGDATEETYASDNTIRFEMPGSRRTSLPAGYSAPPPFQSSVNLDINPGSLQWN